MAQTAAHLMDYAVSACPTMQRTAEDGSRRGIMTRHVDRFEERASMTQVVAVVAASMLLAAGAQAQTPCDQLKAVLSARIDAAGARGYSLEAVPAGTGVPPGAKVIGTCEGGASKILYRRGGAARPTSDTPEAAQPAAPAQAIVAPAPDNASRVEVVRDVDQAAAQQQPTPPDKPAAAKDPPAQPAAGLEAEYRWWIGALFLALLAAAIWVGYAYFSANGNAARLRGRRRGTARQAALRLKALEMRHGLDQPR